MRLLHLADLHVGKVVNGFSMLDDQRFVLEGVLKVLRERAVDALLVAGDVYDKSAPSSEAVGVVDWFLAEAAATGAAVFVTAGNHDAAERVAYAGSLLARQRVYLSPVYDGTIAHYDLEDEHGPVTFWLIPFLRPPAVRPHFPGRDIAGYTEALSAVVGSCGIDRGRRNVALAHQFVTYGGQAPEAGGSELNVGGLDNVDASVFDTFDYVALGHIHRPQRVGRDEVRYSGSPLKYSFGEARGSKSAPLVELGPKGSVSVELVPLVPRHDLREISCELETLVSPAVVGAADPADYLHVVLTDEDPAPDALARLRAVYPNVMGLSFDNARTRTAGVQGGPDEEALVQSPLELFEGFFEAQNGRPLTARQHAVAVSELERAEVM